MDDAEHPPGGAADARARRAAAMRIDPAVSPPLSVGYRVVDGPDGESDAWRVVVDGHAVTVDDRFDDADVTMSCDAATAAAVAGAELSVQQAVLDGRLELGGDLTRLVEHTHVAAAVTALRGDA